MRGRGQNSPLSFILPQKKAADDHLDWTGLAARHPRNVNYRLHME